MPLHFDRFRARHPLLPPLGKAHNVNEMLFGLLFQALFPVFVVAVCQFATVIIYC